MIRILIRKRVEQNGVDNAENRGARANRESDGQDCHGAYQRIRAQASRTIAKIVQDGLKPEEYLGLVRPLTRECCAAETPDRVSLGILAAHTGSDIVSSSCVDVIAHFFLNFVADP